MNNSAFPDPNETKADMVEFIQDYLEDRPEKPVLVKIKLFIEQEEGKRQIREKRRSK